MAMNRHMDELVSIQQCEQDYTTGSVLAIVQFPAGAGRDCNGFAFKSEYRIRVDYKKLMATGSAKLQVLFDPRKQARFRRRFNLQQLPEGIDYVIDLTPPAEGAELADLTALLWLPRATKVWYLAGLYSPDEIIQKGPEPASINKRPLAHKPVGSVLTLGHDDRCSCILHRRDGPEPLWQVHSDGIPGIFEGDHDPEYRQIRDYCPVRHRVNIIRLLLAINGADILINSATRMWTLVHIAIDLEITSVIVRICQIPSLGVI
jgi:hypothetical protein